MTVIFHAQNKTHENKFHLLERELRAQGVDSIVTTDEDLKKNQISKVGLAIGAMLSIILMIVNKATPINSLRTALLSRIFYLKINTMAWFLYQGLACRSPTSIVFSSDRSNGYEIYLRQMCRVYRIKCIILPVSRASSYPEMKLTVEHNIRRLGLKKFRDHFYPERRGFAKKQTGIQVNGRTYHHYPCWMALALERCGIMPVEPYVLGSSNGMRVFVGSKTHKTALLKVGKKEDEIITSRYLDLLLAKPIDRKSLTDTQDRLAISGSLPNCIVALPCLKEHNLVPDDQHWQIIRFIAEELSKEKRANFLISLHPKMDPKEYLPICKQFGLNILEAKFCDTVFAVDIAIVYEGSTLVDVVEEMRLPSIVMGWWGLNYHRKYEEMLEFIDDDRNFHSALKQLVSDFSRENFEVDTQSVNSETERMKLDMFDYLVTE